ncbi:uncharacterized protein HGUI_00194 [Hanseniaspora guilliermondii]|uniref:C2H2-type domain-containing protein n=1 Tax=Hanseniaspora guilliermondii TaxID=56406 RepID=A0A1L0ATW8_9ASCO|nr:uncharacterized protein HGUI_00194 [Hanseniaspora guilliermondii]
MTTSNNFQYPDVSSILNTHKNFSSRNNINVFGTDTSNMNKQTQSSKILERDNSDSGNQPVVCKWENCMTVFMNCELLHKHVGDVHALKQNPDDIDFSCKWGACNKAKFKKREHLLSHLMVHIPLKRFKCVTCQKKFKRSHDLKKHLKIHLRDNNDDLNNNLSSTGSLDSVGSQSSSLIHDQYFQQEYNTHSNFNANVFPFNSDPNPKLSNIDSENQKILYEPPRDVVEELFAQFQDLKTKYYQTLQDLPKELPQYPLVFQRHYSNGMELQTPYNNFKMTDNLNEQDLQQRYQYKQYSIVDSHRTLSSCEMLNKKDRFSNDQQSNKDIDTEYKIKKILDFIKDNILTNDIIIDQTELSKHDLLKIIGNCDHSKTNLQVFLQYLTLCL